MALETARKVLEIEARTLAELVDRLDERFAQAVDLIKSENPEERASAIDILTSAAQQADSLHAIDRLHRHCRHQSDCRASACSRQSL